MEAVLGKKEDTDEFALIDEMERISGVKIPQAIEEIRDAKTALALYRARLKNLF